MTKIVATPEAPKASDDLDQRYADHLEFLWEQYNKLMGIGFIASATTLGFLLQGMVHRHIHCDFYQPKLISNLPQ